jgi:hypothetical protein
VSEDGLTVTAAAATIRGWNNWMTMAVCSFGHDDWVDILAALYFEIAIEASSAPKLNYSALPR